MSTKDAKDKYRELINNAAQNSVAGVGLGLLAGPLGKVHPAVGSGLAFAAQGAGIMGDIDAYKAHNLQPNKPNSGASAWEQNAYKMTDAKRKALYAVAGTLPLAGAAAAAASANKGVLAAGLGGGALGVGLYGIGKSLAGTYYAAKVLANKDSEVKKTASALEKFVAINLR